MCKTRIQEEIEALMSLYHLGKAPLSYALGFGEVTITRYLQEVPLILTMHKLFTMHYVI